VEELVEGRNAVLESLRGGAHLKEVRIAKGLQSDPAVDEIRRLARESRVPVRDVERRALESMSARGAHQGVIAVAEPFNYADLASIIAAGAKAPRSLVVVLDHVTDPGNLGAVARSVEAAGACGLVIPSQRAASVGPVARKTSAGALEHLPVARVPNLVRALGTLKEAGYWAAGASEHAAESAFDARLDDRLVLVLGSEGEGLSRLVSENCDFLVSIPMAGHVGSLNVAQAATLLSFEWSRRAPS
jgi:23S rRNA (guanosine2251-2'-O)-methyltransferase